MNIGMRSNVHYIHGTKLEQLDFGYASKGREIIMADFNIAVPVEVVDIHTQLPLYEYTIVAQNLTTKVCTDIELPQEFEVYTRAQKGNWRARPATVTNKIQKQVGWSVELKPTRPFLLKFCEIYIPFGVGGYDGSIQPLGRSV